MKEDIESKTFEKFYSKFPNLKKKKKKKKKLATIFDKRKFYKEYFKKQKKRITLTFYSLEI